jgi:LysR family transcriptional activator of mexEF-oprN operon
MPESDVRYGRDLDLNLLRVFMVVADTGSVTKAAARLYLTQPGVSSALRRLAIAIDAPLFVRQGRGIALTSAGERLLASVRPHLQALVDAALAPPKFQLATSDRLIRIGLSDATEGLILPPLLAALARHAPHLRLIASPVQFRTVEDALMARRIDMALTVADDLPPSIRRTLALPTGYVCLFDPRHVRIGRVLRAVDYFARDHVIVSYNGDLRGVVEDVVGQQRRVRCALASFSHVGEVIDGSALLATVPEIVARQIRRTRPHLRTRPLPFAPFALAAPGLGPELLWPAATDDDPACRFVREQILAIARAAAAPLRRRAEARTRSTRS